MATSVAPVARAASLCVSRMPMARQAPRHRLGARVRRPAQSSSFSVTPPRVRTAVAAADGDSEPPKEPEREYDEDGLYIGTYSTFWTDPEQLKGVVIFCTVLASFFSLGNVGAALVLPLLYNKPIELCAPAILLGYPC